MQVMGGELDWVVPGNTQNRCLVVHWFVPSRLQLVHSPLCLTWHARSKHAAALATGRCKMLGALCRGPAGGVHRGCPLLNGLEPAAGEGGWLGARATKRQNVQGG